MVGEAIVTALANSGRLNNNIRKAILVIIFI
jgi:hypothetical protein